MARAGSFCRLVEKEPVRAGRRIPVVLYNHRLLENPSQEKRQKARPGELDYVGTEKQKRQSRKARFTDDAKRELGVIKAVGNSGGYNSNFAGLSSEGRRALRKALREQENILFRAADRGREGMGIDDHSHDADDSPWFIRYDSANAALSTSPLALPHNSMSE